MERSIESTFLSKYAPLFNYFVENSKDKNLSGIQEPFMPALGLEYENNPYKIAFIGMEGGDSPEFSRLENYINSNPMDAILGMTHEFRDYYWDSDWTKKGYFWPFIRLFIKQFYAIDDWDEKIFQSFVYSNVNSFERFENKVNIGVSEDYERWQFFKKLSEIFDRSENIIEAFNPKIIILLNKDSDNWFSNQINIEWETIIPSYLRLGLCQNTFIYWTYHPRNMSFTGQPLAYYVNTIIKSIIGKSIYADFPGSQRFKGIRLFQSELEKLAVEFSMNPIRNSENFGEPQSGFYFSKPGWTYFEIGFEFDNQWGAFFYGIKVGDPKVQWNKKESLFSTLNKRKENENKDNNQWWPYWRWFDTNKNWNEETFKKIENGNLIQEIREHVIEMNKILGTAEL